KRLRTVKIENRKVKTEFYKVRKCAPKSVGRRSAHRNHVGGGCGLPRTFHFSVFNFQSSLFVFAVCSFFLALSASALAQTVPDKMVATVTNGSRATPDLITYSDLVWQLALEPSRPVPDHPSSAELSHALRLLEDQLLILQEARKLPSADTPEGIAARDKE